MQPQGMTIQPPRVLPRLQNIGPPYPYSRFSRVQTSTTGIPGGAPENNQAMMFTSTVKPTLKVTLISIQNRHPPSEHPLPPPPNTIIPDSSPSLRRSAPLECRSLPLFALLI